MKTSKQIKEDEAEEADRRDIAEKDGFGTVCGCGYAGPGEDPCPNEFGRPACAD